MVSREGIKPCRKCNSNIQESTSVEDDPACGSEYHPGISGIIRPGLINQPAFPCVEVPVVSGIRFIKELKKLSRNEILCLKTPC